MKYSYNPPLAIKKLFNNFIWESSTDKILLTFDDGPNPGTSEHLLKLLSDNNLKCVFFCVGNNISKYGTLCGEMISEGHVIANHTYNHQIITKAKKEKVEQEIESFNSLLLRKFDYKIKFFRPPHGRFNLSLGRMLREKNITNVMWSLLTYDYKNNLKLVNFAVQKYLKENSIIAMHDSNKSKDVVTHEIKVILEEASKRGYEIGKPAECLK